MVALKFYDTGIDFQCETSLLSTPLTSLSIKQTTLLAARNYLLTSDFDMMLGGVTHKRWYLHGAEKALCFISPKLKKSCTIKSPKSSSCVSSYLNQRLIVCNIQNQSVTDTQTNRQDDYYNPLAQAR